MSNENQAQKATIAEIKDKFFEIPPYQRLYEWESIHIETLLDDMKKAYDDKKEQYFIGNIITSIDKNDSNKFVLIDGQQRLTTLWFIGFYLASKGCKIWQEFILQNNEKLRISMPIRNNEEKALKELARKIIESKDNKDKYKLADLLPSNIYAKIKNAFECIEIWFNNVENIQENKLQDFANFIYTKVCFVFVELAQDTDLNRFFVRMNNRGKQLEKHEILKARILHKISEKEREKYAEIWDLCSDMNRYIFQSKDSEIYEVESIIDFPTFLLHCFKIFMIDNLPQNFTIGKDKLLEFIDIKKLTWEDKNCKEFIKSMLRYRVLFDGFVIKFTAKKGKETNEKESPYEIKRLGSDGNLVNSNLNDLEMIQNYLRVARQGDRINYHHWLTLFLIHLNSAKIGKEIWKIIKCNKDNFEKIDEIAKLFKTDAEVEQDNNKKADTVDTKKLYNETNMITFLENLDTKLAIAQMPNQDNKDEKNKNLKMITIADEILQNLDSVKDFEVNKEFHKNDKWDFLKYGNDIRYWFYRLEYYLWKWGKYKPEKLGSFCKELNDYNFDSNAKNCVLDSKYFHFRMLGSIEHFSAIQRKDERKKEWNLDIFGNLALISQNFNSSLSNQLEQFKKDEVIQQLKRGRLESLKYFIMCANLNGDEWSENDATTHQNQMIDILIKSLKNS